MAKIKFIEFSGKEHDVEIANGTSIMQAALDENVRGIVGDCGGSCSCATCHIYVDESWLDKIEVKSEMEEILLEEVCDPQDNSRLSCQIIVSDALDGMVLRVPEKQF
ncbi:2Fe-2S iron-sulfur cluster-binding protein [Zhongshania aquimaris]|uniref:2Fe-2S iron-sulfur cluster binding domain-containing protein n=1 Tax=Zhongshania aquimaris TaxID=2857107 RepID=A0ABS6VVW2_9GAMM|nr:2Fe-2S iron-sulfur cluster-binding protein [Zhongshania aquimaris]MBW2942495.1 2Fe-2S iron-sulfur cluster binding domain-containing protein [Zhongshania aquimaris]